VRASSPTDLLALAFARRAEDVPAAETAGREMLKRFGSLRALGDASFTDLRDVTGFEDYEVLRAQALMELGRRVGGAGKGPVEAIASAADVMDLLDHLRHEKREHFVAVLLDAKASILRVAQIHIGTLTMSVVGAREVFREAIRDGAASIVVAHNHPSGDPTPSPEDIEVTRSLLKVGELLDIPVLDHVIIGERRYVSLREKGLM